MEAEPPEVISSEPSKVAVKGPRLIGGALVLVLLTVAVVAAVRYHNEAAALRQQLRSAARPRPAPVAAPAVSGALYSLPSGHLTDR